jgi:hypothetical protein
MWGRDSGRGDDAEEEDDEEDMVTFEHAYHHGTKSNEKNSNPSAVHGRSTTPVAMVAAAMGSMKQKSMFVAKKRKVSLLNNFLGKMCFD